MLDLELYDHHGPTEMTLLRTTFAVLEWRWLAYDGQDIQFTGIEKKLVDKHKHGNQRVSWTGRVDCCKNSIPTPGSLHVAHRNYILAALVVFS